MTNTLSTPATDEALSTTAPRWIALKFGGSSVSSRSDWDNIATIVRNYTDQGFKVCLVHSALKNVTNQLETMAMQAAQNNASECAQLMQPLQEQHQALAQELNIDSAVLTPWFESLATTLAQISQEKALSAAMKAHTVAHGELLSSTLGAHFLQKQVAEDVTVQWSDARQFLHAIDESSNNTNDLYLNAVCHPRPQPMLSAKLSGECDVLLTQGFIAENSAKETVLLGREGSDTSAAYFATILQAEKLQIWTDVDGIYTTDPRVLPQAKLLEHVSYNEAFEMAQAGAKVLHPRSLSCVMPYEIPIEIRNTHAPSQSGTVIDSSEPSSKWVRSIALKTNIPVVSLMLGRRGEQPDVMHKAFGIINKRGLNSEVLASTKDSLIISITTENSVFDDSVLSDLANDLAGVCAGVFVSHSAMISLIGCPASQALWHLLQIDAELPEQWLLMSHTSSDNHLSFLINDDDAHNVLSLLHDNLIH